ncbi:MAG: 4Fe-4S binding protein [Candidatus Ranarchaeia archaeon]
MSNPDISVEFAGLKLRSPIILSSSPITKDGETIKRIAKHGAGAAVIKTILPNKYINYRPCMGKLDRGMINCEGWSDLSPDEWIEKEIEIAKQSGIPIIGSIGALLPQELDQVPELARRVAEAGADAIEIPAYNPEETIQMIPLAKKVTDLPIIGKFAIWSFHIEPYIDAAIKAGADALTCIDSMGPAFEIDIEKQNSILGGPGGYGRVSGEAIRPFALYSVAKATTMMKEEWKKPDSKSRLKDIIGCGGVTNYKDIIKFSMAGASAVQVCTSVMMKGPEIISKANERLAKWLKEHDFSSLSDIKGKVLDKINETKETNQIYQKELGIPPTLISEKCTGCKICQKVCQYEAIEMVDCEKGAPTNRLNKCPTFDPVKCYGCGLCVTSCPVGALVSPYKSVR